MAAAITVRGLTKHFGGVPALEDLSFDVLENEVRCVVGPNGAGKSTLFRALSGIMKPDSGSVTILGRDIRGMPARMVARHGVATKFQVPRVFPTLTVAEHVRLASRVGASYGELLGLRRSPQEQQTQSVSDTLESMGLVDQMDRAAGELSHGERQWLEIVMTLVTDPRVLLLDEPGAGMSPDEKTRTVGLINRLAGTMTVLVIEHDLDFVKRIAHRVLVMHQGALLVEGTFAEIAASDDVKRVYLGREE